jgi:peptidoglycan hydrolase CwlO-like protein
MQNTIALKSQTIKMNNAENTINELVENKQLLESLVNELNNKCAEYYNTIQRCEDELISTKTKFIQEIL